MLRAIWLLLTAACLAHYTFGSLSRISSSPGSLSTISSGICVQDAVVIAWVVDNWTRGTELVWIEVRDERDAVIARFDLYQARALASGDPEPSSSLETVDAVPATLEMLHSVIHSWDYGEFKIPNVRTV